MRANLCASRYTVMYGNWLKMYGHVIDSLLELGYSVHSSPFLDLGGGSYFPHLPIGLEGEDFKKDLFVYNHNYLNKLKEDGLYRTDNSLFIKPTGPTPEYFSLDNIGYACHVSITYDKPDFEGYDYTNFFNTKGKDIVNNKHNKWSDREELKSIDISVDIPKDHVLVLSQMPMDETVYNFSFGDHWKKIVSVVTELRKSKEKVVVKLHPEFFPTDQYTEEIKTLVKEWESEGIVVIKDFTSLHDVLPKTKVAIVENSTSGIECLIHKVPVISYGYPEYHWVTKDLRHLTRLNGYIEDMSWYNSERAKSFIAWYCEKFLCYDKKSTFFKLKKLLKI